MTYTKAILEIELFDVEDVITTSPASATGPGVTDTGAGVVDLPAPKSQERDDEEESEI